MGRVSVRVLPSSKKVEVRVEGGIIKVKVRAKPVDGKANKELIEVLSVFLKVSKSSIRVIKGATSKLKLLEIEGMSEEDILKRVSK